MKLTKELINAIASATAHRACCGTEHDASQGKLHGYCVVCGVVWPCDTAKTYLATKDQPYSCPNCGMKFEHEKAMLTHVTGKCKNS